jgi:alpha-beta hydrolase superfamily lysophospholipase
VGPKRVILIVHGLREHIRRYERLIEDLIKISFGVSSEA